MVYPELAIACRSEARADSTGKPAHGVAALTHRKALISIGAMVLVHGQGLYVRVARNPPTTATERRLLLVGDIAAENGAGEHGDYRVCA